MFSSISLNADSQGTTPPTAVPAGLNSLAGGLTALQSAFHDPLQHTATDLANTATSAATTTANAMEMLRGAPLLVGLHKTASVPAESPDKLPEVPECRPRPSAPDYSPKKPGKSGSFVPVKDCYSKAGC
jgi:hypothetical protein